MVSPVLALDACSLPSLSPRHTKALRQALTLILKLHQPLGIFACGSIVRGTPDASSDLDIYVIISGGKRQRIQRYFNSVPAEIFINPPKAVRFYFQQESNAGRQLTAHMLGTGHLVLCRSQQVLALRAEAQSLLRHPKGWSNEARQFHRYIAACSVEDAVDRLGKDPDSAILIGNRALQEILYFYFRVTQRAIPRDKELLQHLKQRAPKLASLVQTYLRISSPRAKMQKLRQISRIALNAEGFFEWQTRLARF
ncbi:MAG: hypothetical protein EBZ48_02675 [Proteobacteria bacterium]|nr:hypothetical protein [Pseudomonadota bacterium]